MRHVSELKRQELEDNTKKFDELAQKVETVQEKLKACQVCPACDAYLI